MSRGITNVRVVLISAATALLCAGFEMQEITHRDGQLETKAGLSTLLAATANQDAAEELSQETCEPSCHPSQFKQWHGSHHQGAMAAANEKTVLGNFNEVTFGLPGRSAYFFNKGERLFVRTAGPGGKLAEFEITYTLGVYPVQQYLIELSGGRLQCLTIAWDSRSKAEGGQRWFSLYPNEGTSPGDPFHWTGRYQNWNGMCAECHVTGLSKNYNPTSDTYETTWRRIGVTCEACHGPGGTHERWAEKQSGKKPTHGTAKGLLVDLKRGSNRVEIEVCAKCHALRRPVSAGRPAGRPLLDTFLPATLRKSWYYPDGQILGEVYEYGSFVQSKMFAQGVRCTDCHDPHSAKLLASGDGLCLACHSPKGNQRFPLLKTKQYDSPSHHFHPVSSAGARCVACHMPSRLYMVIDRRHDHSFRIPRPGLSVKLGTPNSCNHCHTDRPATWAARIVANRHSLKKKGRHYGEAIALGRSRAQEALGALAELAADVSQPAIVRATALELLASYGRPAQAAITAAIRDPDPMVRAAAARALGELPPRERVRVAAPLLTDPIQAVQNEAARVLAPLPRESFGPKTREALRSALGNYEQAELEQADMPAGRLNLGVLYASTGRKAEAEQSYLAAIRMDPRFLPARLNLAGFYNSQGRNSEAEQILRQALGLAGDPASRGEASYALGLILAEENRWGEAADLLGNAARLIRNRVRVRYNYGLALHRLGRDKEAESALLEAAAKAPDDPDIIYAVATFYAEQQRWATALPWAEKLTGLLPEAQGPELLLRRIQSELPSR